VPWQALGPSSLIVVVPAVMGRLATGALVQATRIGQEFRNVLPESFHEPCAPRWKAAVSHAFDVVCIDEAFFVTLLGTSAFQHILNGMTFVLLARGRKASVADLGRYMRGGATQQDYCGGGWQLLKTFAMRFFFVVVWNAMGSQKMDLASVEAGALRILHDRASVL
jgi:hypothetical protein